MTAKFRIYFTKQKLMAEKGKEARNGQAAK